MFDQWVVRLEEGVWLADVDGDPGRTLVEANAIRYDNLEDAVRALADARKFRPFKTATIDMAGEA